MSNEEWLAVRIRENLEWATKRSRTSNSSATAPAIPHVVAEPTPPSIWHHLEQVWWEDNDTFLRAVYILILHREADTAGLEGYVQGMNNGIPRAEIVRRFAESNEAKALGVTSEWFPEMYRLDATLPLFDTRWLLGMKDHREFLIHAYRRLLGREPDEGALKSWGKRLRWRRTRPSRIIRVLLASEERKFLLREADRKQQIAQAASHTRQILDGVGTTESVIRSVESMLTRIETVLEPIPQTQLSQLSQLRQLRQLSQIHTSELSQTRLSQNSQLSQLSELSHTQVTELARLAELCQQQLTQMSELSITQLSRMTELSHAELAQIGHSVAVTQALREQEHMRWWHQSQHVFAQQASFDKLRSACMAVLKGANQLDRKPEVHPIRADGHQTNCRICDGELVFKWSKKVLDGKYDAEYFECRTCRALQVPNPTWLAEAYSDEFLPRCWNPDTGRFFRVFSVYCYLVALHDAGLTASGPKFLDFGGGQGLLTQMLFNGGHDAWTCDAFVPHPLFGEDRSITDIRNLADHSIDVLTSFEVFEHLTDPREVMRQLRRVLKPDGVFVLSTEIYNPEKHGSEWHYLSPDLGQHITFWSREAMTHLAAEFGFESVGYFPGNEWFCTVFHMREASELRAGLVRAMSIVRDADFLERATRKWEFIRNGFVTLPSQPDVVSVRPQGALRCAS